MGSSLNQGLFSGPQHPYKKGPKRDPNLENYPYDYQVLGPFGLKGAKAMGGQLRAWTSQGNRGLQNQNSFPVKGFYVGA